MKRCLLLFVLMMMLPLCALADGLDLSVKEYAHGFQDNEIFVSTDAAGILTLSVSDDYNVYNTWTQEVPAGDTTIVWNGLGYNEERIPNGKHTLRGSLQTADGSVQTAETRITMSQARNAVVFALPCADTLYLGGPDKWYCEVRLIRGNEVLVIEYYRAGEMDKPLGKERDKISGVGVIDFTWNGKINKKAVEPGEYVLRFYPESNPSWYCDASLTVSAGKAPELPLEISPITMPEPGMSDAEIWAIMQQPSVVADLKKQTDHLTLYAEKGNKGEALGTVHGQSQGLRVIKLEGKYAFVGAWNHETGDYVEGWVKQSDLKVVQPRGPYGLLVDKTAQTMTVYYEGEKLDTFRISTGLPVETRMIRETPAGAYLTVDRIAYFEDEGYQYDYVIRYDGGNLIHQMGYEKTGSRKDFSDHTPLIGAKASHGCIRVSNVPSEQGINAYWLYTRIPYGTRLILMDDPEQRALQAAAAGEAVELPRIEPQQPSAVADTQTEVTLTIAGNTVLGTRETWWKREDAFPAYLEQNGAEYPFRHLAKLFAEDDLTIVQLDGVLKADKKSENKSQSPRYRGLPTWADVLSVASVEHASVATAHFNDYGNGGQTATLEALAAAGVTVSGQENNHVVEVQGKRIGLGGCTLADWQKDPHVVYRDMLALEKLNCDVRIYICDWGEEAARSKQEQMAAAVVAAGADIIIGSGPSTVQGLSSIGDVPVLYGLGHAVCGGTLELTSFDAMLARLMLRFDDLGYAGCTVSLIPILTSGQASEGVNDYSPVLAQGADQQRILDQVQADTAFTLMTDMYFPASR